MIERINQLILLSFVFFFAKVAHPGEVHAAKNLLSKNQSVILVLGDSLAAGYGVAKEDSYPAQLEKLLHQRGHSAMVKNPSISGSTTASALSRLKWQLKSHVDILLLELGGNDGLRGLAISATKKNLEQTIRLAKEQNIKILLAGMKLPANYGSQYRSQFSTMFAELAKENKIEWIPFLLEKVGGKKRFNLEDGIHPNEEGHHQIAKNLLPFVEKLL